MWQPKTIAGVTYDLSHLEPFEMVLVIAAKDRKPEQRYVWMNKRIRVPQ